MELDAPVGVIADTHGLLRDEALTLLEGCGLIIHLGDVGHRDEDQGILERLETIAPTKRVRGNIDTAAWGQAMPFMENLTINGWALHLVHRLKDADPLPATHVILHAHSHKPRNQWQEGRLYFNPGAAGKRRFKLPITLGKLWLEEQSIKRAVIHLPI